MEMFAKIVQNIALLVVLVFLEQEIIRLWRPSSRAAKILSGLLFGGLAVASMMTPLQLAPGYIFDARAVPLAAAGLFGGPVAAFVSAAVAVTYRVAIGGVGAPVGALTIVLSSLAGVVAGRLDGGSGRMKTLAGLLGLGFAAQGLTLAAQVTFLGDQGMAAVRSLGPVLIVAIPFATAVAGRLLVEREHRALLEREVDEKTERLTEALNGVIDVIANMVGLHDPYTYGHQRRVAQLASTIAREMGLSEQEIRDIELAAVVHDVGKLAVPAAILGKKGPLDTEERGLVQQHVTAGHVLLDSPYVDDRVSVLVYQHHERCDGSGYPRGLTCDEILTGAKILAVSDVVEAMSLDRPYRHGLGIEAALEEVRRGSGTAYDPDVVRACLAVFESGFDFDTDDGQGGFVLPL